MESVSLIGSSPSFSTMVNALGPIARASRTTLITGPTGCGKELVAKKLHQLSPRSDSPLITVNCGAIPDTMIESELFGHVRGAFTGATDTRKGLVGAASEGTLFLDEVNSLSFNAQSSLLRFLESGEYRQIGSDVTRKSSAWTIAATNEDLEKNVREGRFREDLLYRLEVVKLEVPPLCVRKEDILLLAEHFLYEVCGPDITFDASARRAMLAHSWPGNVRELKNRVENAGLFGSCDGVISAKSLRLEDKVDAGIGPAVSESAESLPQQLWALVENNGMNLGEAVSLCESILVKEALRQEKGNRTRAAKCLGIHVRTLFKKLATENDCKD